ncbi:MAG: hypothetical protein LBC74_14805 [Planctomycetaceae bacterium]|jgi:hypothetical protein|nr:hypothetical protein [Planctomycetaceae bacterium]
MAYSSYRVRDVLLQREKVLAATAATDPIDLGILTANGSRLEEYEIRLWAEASLVAVLPANKSATYTIQFADTPDFEADVDEYTSNLWKQTGSADGAPEMEAFFRVPTKTKRYVRLNGVTNSAGTPTARFGFEILG